MRRPQFCLKTLLWLMVVVAAFFGGRSIGIKEERQSRIDALVTEQESLRDDLARQRDTMRAKVRKNIKVMEEQQRFLEEVGRSVDEHNRKWREVKD